jgi:predicted DNA-binding transcriptional regulator YafY
MDRLERFYKIDHLLQARKVVPLHSLQEELEVSPATLKRDLEYMRSRFNAPIIWDRVACGYRFDKYIEATEMEDEKSRKELMDQILAYNQEDLAATWAVLKWLKAKAS